MKIEIYRVEKILEAVPTERSYIDMHIFDRKNMQDYIPVGEVLNTELIEKKRLEINAINTPNGVRHVAYDPSLEREFGYPVNMMSKLISTQNELSKALRKYENEMIKNEQMRQWYKEHIENASLSTRLKWVLTGVQK